MSEAVVAGAVTPELTQRIEEVAVFAARELISARRIIEVEGPYGIGLTEVEVGNDEQQREASPTDASAVVSRALSVPLLYRRFALSKRRIAAFAEAGRPLNLKAAEDAAQAVAALEEEIIYQGRSGFQSDGLLTVAGRQNIRAGNWSNVDEVLEDVITAVNLLDGKGYRGPYGLALAPELYNNLFRRYAGSDLLQIEHLKRLCTRGIVKATIPGGVLLARDVGSIVLGQDLQVNPIASDAAHQHFAVSESLVLKIEAPDAICTITPASKDPKARK
jgi:uncharacterized linocin/CFP29 family protein